MADVVEGVFTKVASGMDPVKFLSVEIAVGVRLEFLFLFFLEDVMFRFYLLKKMSDSCFCLTFLRYSSAIYKFKFDIGISLKGHLFWKNTFS